MSEFAELQHDTTPEARELPVRDRRLTAAELERMRLMLSTFRDGSGQRVKAGYMPDFLAFERVTAIVVKGTTNENKGIFDVTVKGGPGRLDWGISCKMAAAQPARRACWFMELSNSSKKFHDALNQFGVDWTVGPSDAGPVIVATVELWHQAVADRFDLSDSKYLLLTRSSSWTDFEVACFDLSVLTAVPAADITWATEGSGSKPSSVAGYIDTPNGPHRLWQHFLNSGGQLKFYPPFGWENWRTGTFSLAEPRVKPLPEKVDEYWPGAWPLDSITS